MGEKLEAELNPLVMTACQLAAARIRVHNSKQTKHRQRTLIFSINVTLLNEFVHIFSLGNELIRRQNIFFVKLLHKNKIGPHL